MKKTKTLEKSASSHQKRVWDLCPGLDADTDIFYPGQERDLKNVPPGLDPDEDPSEYPSW